jgi:hypothetical protein
MCGDPLFCNRPTVQDYYLENENTSPAKVRKRDPVAESKKRKHAMLSMQI